MIFILQITQGTVYIDFSEALGNSKSVDADIIESRFLRSLLGLVVGGSSAIIGLGIQTLFKNPLAGPTTLGVNSGASLGVGIFYLIPGIAVEFQWIGLSLFAVAGALLLLFLLLSIAGKSFNLTFVLIVGLLFSYASYAVLEVLMQLSDDAGMKSYVFWGMGSFNRGTWLSLALLGLVEIIGVSIMVKLSNWLNIYSLGDKELKLLSKKSIRLNKRLLLIVFGIWIGSITSVVGPIAFVGIVVPNILKIILRTSNIKILLPLSLILGANLVLLADLISRGAIFGFMLPINAVLSVLGVPVIIYFLIKRVSGVRS